MQPLLTAAQTREAEAQAERRGLPASILMENAGTAVAEAALTLAASETEGPLVLVRARLSSLANDPDASVEWQAFEVAGHRVDVPMFGSGKRIWAIVPMRGAVMAEVVSTPVVIRPVYDYGHHHYYY